MLLHSKFYLQTHTDRHLLNKVKPQYRSFRLRTFGLIVLDIHSANLKTTNLKDKLVTKNFYESQNTHLSSPEMAQEAVIIMIYRLIR